MSVKWYKNYVEFFRTQPNGGGESVGSNWNQSDVDQSDNTNQASSLRFTKREFELEGINLDVSVFSFL